jgi:hypothetical protein
MVNKDTHHTEDPEVKKGTLIKKDAASKFIHRPDSGNCPIALVIL